MSKALGRPAPFLVQFSITNRCDSRCLYCYARYYERPHEDMPVDRVMSVIDQLAQAGTWRVNLVGGEPLLRKDAGEIIRYVKKKNMECAMTSNGHLVPQKMAEIKELDLLCISLDGDRRSHDANRGEGSFDRAMKGLDAAFAAKVPLQIATVLTKYNLDSLDFLFSAARKYNANIAFTTLIAQSSAQGKRMPETIPSDEEYKNVLRRIITAKKNGAPVLFSAKALEYCLNWPFSYAKDRIFGRAGFKTIRCLAGMYYAIIDVNGDVYPCPAMVGQVPARNCLKEGFKAAFDFAAEHDCSTCHFPCNNEFNLLFALEPSIILNFLKNAITNRKSV